MQKEDLDFIDKSLVMLTKVIERNNADHKLDKVWESVTKASYQLADVMKEEKEKNI